MSIMRDMAVKNIEDLLVHANLKDADINIDYKKGVATVSATFNLTHKQMETKSLGVDNNA